MEKHEDEEYLFVSNIKFWATTDKIRNYFTKLVGPVHNIDMIYSKSGTFTGKALVVFCRRSDARKAALLATINHMSLDGRKLYFTLYINNRPMDVNISIEPKNGTSPPYILMTNLSYNATIGDLEVMLQPFREQVVSSAIHYHPDGITPTGRAHALFTSTDDAKEAVRTLHGQTFLGRNVNVRLPPWSEIFSFP